MNYKGGVRGMSEYTIGLDFGTLSARGVLLSAQNGSETAVSEFIYPHGILQQSFFEGKIPDKDTSLQHPQDYLDAIAYITKDLVAKSGIAPAEVKGIGVDFTACTVLPVLSDGTPLCFLPEYKNEPHAYVKLWNHHSPQKEAEEITALAKAQNAPWLGRYGGNVSVQWMFPKMLETLRKAPNVYDKAARFTEAADWVVWMLTGIESHSSSIAGYKALYSPRDGYPDNDFWAQLDSRFADVVGTKVSTAVIQSGTKAGELSEYASCLTGLPAGTAVASPIADAHASLPGAGIARDKKLMLIIGTSGCHIIMSKNSIDIPGVCGYVADGIVPGYYAYEAGQSCVGDCIDWFVKNCLPKRYYDEAGSSGISVYDLLNKKASLYGPGESGILVLDWWKGSRTPLSNADLSGTIVGLNMQTKPEDIYRGIIESAALGTRKIIELYESHGIAIDEVFASGGIPQKNPFLMQIYADATGKSIRIVKTAQAAARGSAVLAAAAAGLYPAIGQAIESLGEECTQTYIPDPENHQKYSKLYALYNELSDYFGRENTSFMKKLKDSNR